jgi:hypothetical protein
MECDALKPNAAGEDGIKSAAFLEIERQWTPSDLQEQHLKARVNLYCY